MEKITLTPLGANCRMVLDWIAMEQRLVSKPYATPDNLKQYAENSPLDEKQLREALTELDEAGLIKSETTGE